MTDTIKPLFSWRAAIVGSQLAPTTRHVALTLSLYMSELGDSAFPGAERLSRDTGLSVRCVREHLGELRERGWLELVAKGGLKGERRSANIYRAALPDPQLIPDPCTRVTRNGGAPVTLTPPTPAPERVDPCTTITPSLQELSITKERGARTRRTQIVIPFHVTEKMQEWALKKCPGLDWARETELFVDYWKSTGEPKADWEATWRTWMRRAHAGVFK